MAKEPTYEPEALRSQIELCKQNIERFREAIQKEMTYIDELEFYLREAEKEDA